MAQLALALLALLLPASAQAAPVLRVSLPEGLACPSSGELLKSLSERFGADRVAAGQASDNELGLSLAQLPDGLELDLVSKPGEAPYRRRIPSGEGSCADLAETIGLLVDAWLRDLPWHGVGFLRDVPEVVRPGPRVLPEREAAGTEAGATERAVRRSPATQTASAHKAESTEPAEHRNTLTLRVGVGASLGSNATNLGPEGTLSADVTLFRGLGAAVFATALENASAADQRTPTASISVSRQVFTLAARFAFAAENGNGLRVFAGLALQTLESQSSGYAQTPSNFVPAPAGFVAALWQQQLWRRLSAYAQLSATIGPQVDFKAFEAGTPRTVLSLPPAWIDASIGLALSFR